MNPWAKARPLRARIMILPSRVTQLRGMTNLGAIFRTPPNFSVYPVPPVESLKVEWQNAPCVGAGMNVPTSLLVQPPKATDLSAGAQAGVSPWYRVYLQVI